MINVILYRNVRKLIQGTSGMLAQIQTYFYNKKSITRNVNILYQDGLVSVNSNSKVLVIENDIKDLYSSLYQDTEALSLIKSEGLNEKDVLLGRSGVYILIKNNSKKLAIKNNTTDLKTILEQNIAIDNAFLTSLQAALGEHSFTHFQAALLPVLSGYITQKTQINTLITSLLDT